MTSSWRPGDGARTFTDEEMAAAGEPPDAWVSPEPIGYKEMRRSALKLTQEYRVGIRPDGRYCLACGKPLYGPELSHTPPAQPSAVDRWRQ